MISCVLYTRRAGSNSRTAYHRGVAQLEERGPTKAGEQVRLLSSLQTRPGFATGLGGEGRGFESRPNRMGFREPGSVAQRQSVPHFLDV